ncbi:hypothetical protein [Sphingomonas sp. BK235]|uniref:hypothetical protein n=1 Tax=Sphingomonas sp. BK235 TaxID=2512131 RepID=UPI0010475194|nr:hypothetical protein [Sphingomonas sp. BK235]TCP37210.1 hypothetical protein EV292_101719 [Sphingomonas sp. BK235]
MGFVALLLLGGGALAALVLLRADRALWTLLAAALCLGGAGYAWQGAPGLAAAPARARAEMTPIEPEEIALRDSLLGRYTADTAYLVAADAMTRSGNDSAAARVVLGGLSKMPRSFILWTWAGVTLAADADDQLSPPALLAFRQATRLAPDHPAPAYYLGMTYLKAGQLPQARACWVRAIRLSAPGTDYRRELVRRLLVLDRFIAASGAAR